MLELMQDLCRSVAGPRCSPPRWSDWSLVAPSQAGLNVAVARVAMAGGAAVAPVNVKAHASYFVTGLINPVQAISMSLHGLGQGVSIFAGSGAGESGVGGTATREPPGTLSRVLAEQLGAAGQGHVLQKLADAAGFGVRDGARVLCGPNAPTDRLAPSDFAGFATIASLGANFLVNGVSLGVVVFSKRQPVVDAGDLIHATAIGLVGSVGLATSVDGAAAPVTYAVSVG